MVIHISVNTSKLRLVFVNVVENIGVQFTLKGITVAKVLCTIFVSVIFIGCNPAGANGTADATKYDASNGSKCVVIQANNANIDPGVYCKAELK